MHRRKYILSFLILTAFIGLTAHSQEELKAAESSDNAKKTKAKTLSDLQKEIRAINQQLNKRKRKFYRENSEIVTIQSQIKELQNKIKEIIDKDEEYTKLINQEKGIREELQAHYRKRRSERRKSKPEGSAKRINQKPEGSNKQLKRKPEPEMPRESIPD